MNDVTPDLIAEIATRLLQEGSQPSVGQIPSGDTYAPTGYASHVAAPASYVPAGNVPSTRGGTSPGNEHFQTSTSFVPSASPTDAQVGLNSAGAHPADAYHFAPTEFSQFSRQLNGSIPFDVTPVATHEVADVSPDGLRRFVEQIRNPEAHQPVGFCPGAPGVSFLQQILSPKQIPAPRDIGRSSGTGHPVDSPRLSGLASASPRQAADLVRQCGDHAEATICHRRHFVLLRARQFEHPSRSTLAGGTFDRRVRRRTGQGSEIPGCGHIQRNHFRPRHHRRDQSDRANLRTQISSARRRNPAFHFGTSCEHRSVADDREREGCRDSSHPGKRPGGSDA